MTDFVQTMNDWRRMCQHMEKMGGDRSCDICPLGGCNAIYEEDGSTDYAEIGEKVATWAAEHSEPVYPTWEEWLITQGVIKENPNGGVGWPMPKLFECIPADIAQLLGLKPLPIVNGDCGATNEADARNRLGLQPKEVNRGT